jgi:hypothetical protein
MSHEIYGERFFARAPAWHNLGNIKDVAVSASKAIGMANIDVTYSLNPLMVDLGGVQVQVEDKVAIVRSPANGDDQYRIMGYASPNYGLLQPADIGQMLDPLTDEWPVSTCGMLKEGTHLFMTLDAGEADIKGDPVQQYFLFSNRWTGRHGVLLAFTPVRVVCQNTFTIGEAAAISKNVLVHHKDVQQEIEWRVAILKQLQEVQHKVMHNFELFAETALKARAAKSFIKSCYPLPRKPAKVRLVEELDANGTDTEELADFLEATESKLSNWQNRCARTELVRDAAYERYQAFNDEIEQRSLAETLWAGYNAVVEVEDYRQGKAGDETGSLASALFGQRALRKQRAFNEAMAVIER